MSERVSTCRSCGAAVRWVETVTGKVMPVDAEPTPEGNIVLLEEGRARVLRKGEEGPVGACHVSHFATCPNAASHRRKA